MSMHKQPLTDLERAGLEKHRLPIGTPSQLADCFRQGVRHAVEAHGVPDGWQLVRTDVLKMAVGFAVPAMERDRDSPSNSAWMVEAAERNINAVRAMLASATPAPRAEPAPAGSGGWEAHAKALEQELVYWKQRAQAMHEHQKGECWYWQGDGNDHPESMVGSLPVVIRADALRDLMKPQSGASQQESAARQHQVNGQAHLETQRMDHHTPNGEHIKDHPLVFGERIKDHEAVEQMDPDRSAFEAWLRMDSTLPVRLDEHGYTDFTVALMWRAWQAASNQAGSQGRADAR